MKNNFLKKIFNLFNGAPQKQSSNIAIETPRMLLREIEMSDKNRILEISNTPGFAHYCFDGSVEKVDDFLKKCIDGRTPKPDTGFREYIMLAMQSKETGDFIGCVSIENKCFVPGTDYEINFFVDPKYQKSGFGREAVVNAARYVFEDMKMPAINVTIEPDNAASLKVAAHEGYVDIGKTVDIKTPCFGTHTYKILLLSKETFYSQRKNDKKPLLLPKP